MNLISCFFSMPFKYMIKILEIIGNAIIEYFLKKIVKRLKPKRGETNEKDEEVEGRAYKNLRIFVGALAALSIVCAIAIPIIVDHYSYRLFVSEISYCSATVEWRWKNEDYLKLSVYGDGINIQEEIKSTVSHIDIDDLKPGKTYKAVLDSPKRSLEYEFTTRKAVYINGVKIARREDDRGLQIMFDVSGEKGTMPSVNTDWKLPNGAFDKIIQVSDLFEPIPCDWLVPGQTYDMYFSLDSLQNGDFLNGAWIQDSDGGSGQKLLVRVEDAAEYPWKETYIEINEIGPIIDGKVDSNIRIELNRCAVATKDERRKTKDDRRGTATCQNRPN